MSEAHTVVIFGASGDLNARKLMPALYNLHRLDKLPASTRVVGHGRRDWSDDAFRDLMREAVAKAEGEAFDAGVWQAFSASLHYFRGEIDALDDYRRLEQHLRALEGETAANRLYYLAITPDLYETIVTCLHDGGLARSETGWRRVVIEKPFGSDGATAQHLNEVVHRAFSEEQVFRIDHFLGKETVQNVLFLRFANAIFEPIWNRNYVDHVQITVAETVDVGSRAGYYDQAGVLLDMFQNHMLQLLTITAMEPPLRFEATALRNEKVKVLGAIRTPIPGDIVRAQYTGYRDAPGIAPHSHTPTYAALKLYIDNWRWQDVPFYLRSGKAMAAKSTEIIVQFRRPPHQFFDLPENRRLHANVLSLCIQPDEGIHLSFQVKEPAISKPRSVDMEFHYRDFLKDGVLPEAYERLILDALQGDATLFTREDEIELSWKLIDTIQTFWDAPHAPPLATYPRGSWGPEEADLLLADDGRVWKRGCGGHR
jgi:glucose-6-phosphate 1-dehydrogenase